MCYTGPVSLLLDARTIANFGLGEFKIHMKQR